jgi:hypothetical protein
MPSRPITESDIALSSSSAYVKKYPNPFFDIASSFVPKNIKTLFKYCRTFFYTNAFLRNVVTKLTEYPITDLLYDSDVSIHVKEKYNEYLNQDLKIKNFLIELGLDYFTFGNAFVIAHATPKRFLKCSACGEEHLIDNVKYKFKNFSFDGECPVCKGYSKFIIKDEFIKNQKNLKFVRYAPENIDIDYNPITSDATYYYSIPNKIKAKIAKGDKHILKTIPSVFIESLKNRKKIELDPNNFYHFKRPTLAEEDMGWGKPIILPALKEIYYLQTLKKGNEAIANEHIIPKKSIFPANTTTLDPFTTMNLGKWKGKIEEQIKKWKSDPNHIGVFPIPIGYQELGGNARNLLLTPEMKFLEESIINSLGVPLEFIKGGTTWTGSSISLRIVENHFLTYRELLTDFINHFMVKKIHEYLSYPKITLKFKKFRMTDDSEAKQLAINLNASGKISDKKLLDEFGYDSVTEIEELKNSKQEYLDALVKEREAQATGEGKAQEIMAKYQARAQHAIETEQSKIKTELFHEELSEENKTIPEDPSLIIEKYSREVLMYPIEQRTAILEKLYKEMPVTASFVAERIQEIEARLMAESGMVSQEEIPELSKKQGAPEKAVTKEDEIPVEGERHKGKTKGTP